MSEALSVFDNLPYFAYGSNLNDQDWDTWCQSNMFACGPLKAISRATAPDYRLVFGKHSTGRKGGVADIRPAYGHVVDGALFALTEAQRSALAAKEGAPVHYEPFALTVLDEGGNLIPAFSYRVTPAQARPHVDPHVDYVNVVSSGLSSHGLSSLAPWEAAGTHGLTLSPITCVFVYGTLLSGQSRAWLLPEDAVRHPAVAKGRLVNCGAYPGYVPGPTGNVRGELVEIAEIERVIEVLDRVEGHDPNRTAPQNLFQRRLITLAAADGTRVRAWTYIRASQTEHLPVIQSGDWLFHSGAGRAEAEKFKQSAPATIASHDWILTELRRLRRAVTTHPEIFANTHRLTYGAESYWSGGELALLGPEIPVELLDGRDKVVITRYAAEFTGLFVLCEKIFSQSQDAGSWRAAYGHMSPAIRVAEGAFEDRAIAALELAEAFATDIATAASLEGLQ